tara:strand:+ start:1025 stop:3385 length:2361 start_codon:yes stop_codon:yes gene_type:complete
MAGTKITTNVIADDAIAAAHIGDGVITTAHISSSATPTFTDLTLTGNLTVQGTTTTLDTATLNVEDKNITLNYGSGDTSSSADGAGITIQDAVNSSTDATILWDASNDEFDFSHKINVANITVGDGHTIGNDGDDNLAIASSSGENIVLDSADDIILDADGGDFIFKDGGVEQARLKSGSLGIGENNPDYQLHISGAGDLLVEDTGNGSAHVRLRSSNSGTSSSDWKLKTGSNNFFYIDNDTGSAGNAITIDNNGTVGLNKTSGFATGGFGTPLLVLKQRVDSTWGGILIEANGNDSILALGTTDTAHVIAGSYRSSAGYKDLDITLGGTSNRMHIQASNGYIGINRDDPSYFLDIYGPSDTQLRIDTASGNAGLFYAVAGSNKWEVYHRNPDNTFRIYNYTTTQPEFMIAGATGHIGIGTVTPQNQFEVWNDDDNAFVSVGVKQHSSSTFQGIHFGYAESGNSDYRKSAIVFERTDLTSGNAQGKVHLLNGPQSGGGSATLSDRKITIMENGNVEVPFIRAGAWSGQAMHTNGTDAIELGVSGSLGYVHGYDRTNSHYIDLAYDGTTHRFATSGGFSNVHIDGNGNMAVNTGENSNTAANVTNSKMDTIAHTGTVLSNNGPVVMGRSDGSNSGETGAQYTNSNEPRCIRNWFTYAGPSSNSYSSPYVHMKTDLWAGGSPNGNTEFTMSCITFYDYYGYGSNYSCYGTSGWHNWGGGYYNKMLRNYGNWDIAYDPYTSTDGYVVIVARIPNAYSQFSVDWAQWGGYTFRERKITNVAQHNAATGKY